MTDIRLRSFYDTFDAPSGFAIDDLFTLVVYLCDPTERRSSHGESVTDAGGNEYTLEQVPYRVGPHAGYSGHTLDRYPRT